MPGLGGPEALSHSGIVLLNLFGREVVSLSRRQLVLRVVELRGRDPFLHLASKCISFAIRSGQREALRARILDSSPICVKIKGRHLDLVVKERIWLLEGRNLEKISLRSGHLGGHTIIGLRSLHLYWRSPKPITYILYYNYIILYYIILYYIILYYIIYICKCRPSNVTQPPFRRYCSTWCS